MKVSWKITIISQPQDIIIAQPTQASLNNFWNNFVLVLNNAFKIAYIEYQGITPVN